MLSYCCMIVVLSLRVVIPSMSHNIIKFYRVSSLYRMVYDYLLLALLMHLINSSYTDLQIILSKQKLMSYTVCIDITITETIPVLFMAQLGIGLFESNAIQFCMDHVNCWPLHQTSSVALSTGNSGVLVLILPHCKTIETFLYYSGCRMSLMG